MATRAKKASPPEALPPEVEGEELPSWWNWDVDGNVADGVFVRAGAGFTKLGVKNPFVVLTIDGTERTVWAHHEALRSKIRERISEHGPIEPGERMVIRHDPAKRTSAEGREYFAYTIEFPDIPEPDQYDLFGAEKKEEKEREPSPADPNDDSIPFEPK